MTWERIPGVELLTYGSLTDLELELPSCAALYLWQRTLRPPKQARALERWLISELAAPVTRSSGQVRHFLRLEAFGLGGYELTLEKRKDLRKLLRNGRQREEIRRYLLSLEQFMPVVYFGETGQLAQRIWQHLSAETGFGQQVMASKVLQWRQLVLRFKTFPNHDPLALEGPQKRKRTLLEAVGTIFTLSPSVMRIG